MKQLRTKAIILRRTDYGEADRILTLLTPDFGKLSLIAKGVRRSKSKLAGGIELFSVSDIGFIQGRGAIGTLVSTQLITHYATIVEHVDRTMLGYDLIAILHKATEDELEPAYFELLEQTFGALNNPTIDAVLVRIWFAMQLLRLGGQAPNLAFDTSGSRLTPDVTYEFSYDDMAFSPRAGGIFGASEIKFLRVGFAGTSPEIIQKITGLDTLLDISLPLLNTMSQMYLRS